MRLIDADALNEAFDNEGADLCMDYGESCEWGFSYKSVHDLIGNAPTVDAEPVRHGHWEEIQLCRIYNEDIVYSIGYKCNQCERVESKKEPYCHCGAKMDEVSE